MIDALGVGSGVWSAECGVGSGEWGVGSGEWGVGSVLSGVWCVVFAVLVCGVWCVCVCVWSAEPGVWSADKQNPHNPRETHRQHPANISTQNQQNPPKPTRNPHKAHTKRFNNAHEHHLNPTQNRSNTRTDTQTCNPISQQLWGFPCGSPGGDDSLSAALHGLHGFTGHQLRAGGARRRDIFRAAWSEMATSLKQKLPGPKSSGELDFSHVFFVLPTF